MDDHVRKIVPTKYVIPYSDVLFREAAVEWLITTNQPIQAVDHPSFKKMVDIASQATKSVIIPNQNITRREIMELFKKQMVYLKEQLNV
ncbi:hypothetical protein F5I97DRAFT_1792592, partial [Phlebopus sp. FC_14]